MADFLRSCPLLYRDVQGAFTDSATEFVASVQSRTSACIFSEPSPHFPSGTPDFPVGFWFLSPEQHITELLVFNAVFLPLIWWLLHRPLPLDVPALPADQSSSRYAASRARANHPVLVCLDGLCTLAVWGTAALTVYFKLRTDCLGRPRLAYLLQPCHLSNFILLLLSCQRASAGAAWLFEFYLVSAYGALLALATPDLRGLDLFPFGWPGWEGYTWEKVSFFVQHALLLLLPAVWIARRRFDLVKPPSADWQGCLTMWAVFSAMHWDLFAPVSYATGHNVNYMLAPPGALWGFGKHYRLVMLLACLPISCLMRMGYDLAVRASGVREEAALEEQLAEGKAQAPSAALASSGAGAMPVAAPARARAGSSAGSPAASASAAGKAAASTSVKKRRDTGLQGEYWNTLSPRTRR